MRHVSPLNVNFNLVAPIEISNQDRRAGLYSSPYSESSALKIPELDNPVVYLFPYLPVFTSASRFDLTFKNGIFSRRSWLFNFLKPFEYPRVVPGQGNQINRGGLSTMKPSFIPPSKKLYRSRHKITRDDLWKSLTVDDLTLSVHEPNIIDYAVPVLQPPDASRRTTWCSDQSSSVFSVIPGVESEAGSQDDLTFKPNDDLQNLMFRNYSLDSLILSNKKRISEHEENVRTLKIVSEEPAGSKYTTCARPHNLPPMPTTERAQHGSTIKELVKHAEHVEKLEVQKLKFENRRLVRTDLESQKRWDMIKHVSQEDILIEVRRNNLIYHGIPWQMRPLIYDLCLMKDARTEHVAPFLDKWRVKLDKLLEDRSDEIFANLCTRSKWLTTGKASVANFYETFESQFEALYYHITVILRLDPTRDFIWPLMVETLCDVVENGPRELSMRLLDIFILTSYYHELDSVLDRIWPFVLRNHSYRFFGSQEDINKSIKSVHIDLPLLLQWLKS